MHCTSKTKIIKRKLMSAALVQISRLQACAQSSNWPGSKLLNPCSIFFMFNLSQEFMFEF
jgi:hypothetical protein